MASKWEIKTAIRSSGLPAPARLILHTLADLADQKTCIIPPERTPSLGELAEWTGLDKSTVTRHLNGLESAGWVVRDRPDVKASRNEHVRTGYRIALPRGAESTTDGGAECNTDFGDEDAPEDETVVHSASSENGLTGSSHRQGTQSRGAHNTTARGAENTTARGAQRTTSLFHETNGVVTKSSPAKNPRTPTKKTKPKPSPKTHRADVEKICNHLADRIAGNGSLRPNITEKWRADGRLLLDKDGRTVDQVLKAIDWCQSDPFWRTNILSMPKLRAKYDQLRLSAQRKTSRASPASQLTEVNGLHLKPSNIELAELTNRMRQLDQKAIGG